MKAGLSRLLLLVVAPGLMIGSGLGVCVLAAAPASAVPTPNGADGFGANGAGQLGDGNATDSDLPVVVSTISSIQMISVGSTFSLALLDNGTVMAWGDNSHGQLGDGNTTPSDVPVAVSGLPQQVKAIAAGGDHALALLKNGTVMAWGDNSNGQLGDGNTTDSDVPVPVDHLSGVRAVKAGQSFSLAIAPYGTVMAWGDNSNGQLGDGNTTDSDDPVAVSGLSNDVRDVSAGDDFALAILGDQTVVAWGDNSDGQLGDGNTTDSDVPVPVSGLTFVRALAAGGAHALALLSQGKVAAWGDNSNGQLGDGNTTDSDVPITLGTLTKVSSVRAGEAHSLVMLSNRTAMAWGDNSNGQLGDGNTTDSDVPVAVVGATGITAISAGGDFSLDRAINLPPAMAIRATVRAHVDAAFSHTTRVRSRPFVSTISETGGLPTGVTFTDHGDNTATLSGTPAPGTEGTYTVHITASNGVGSPGTQTLILSVT